MSENALEAKVMEIKRLESLIAEAQEEADSLKDEIKAEMTTRGIEELHCGAFKAIWKTITSARFDSTAFKKAQPDLYAEYTKQSCSRRFTIA